MGGHSEIVSPRKSTVLIAVAGGVVVAAHMVAAIWFGMTALNWMGGASIGLIIIMVAVAHLMIPGHIRNRVVDMNQQFLYWAIAAGLGLLAGLFGSILFSHIRWGILLLGGLSAVIIGRQLTGNPKTKTMRLGIYGIVSSATFFNVSTSVKSRSLSEIFTFSIFAGVMCVFIGLVTHLTLGPKKAKNK